MDTSEFDRIAFLAGTVSLLPQDMDRMPCLTTTSESNHLSEGSHLPAESQPGK
jgi:hypothetical protein